MIGEVMRIDCLSSEVLLCLSVDDEKKIDSAGHWPSSYTPDLDSERSFVSIFLLLEYHSLVASTVAM